MGPLTKPTQEHYCPLTARCSAVNFKGEKVGGGGEGGEGVVREIGNRYNVTKDQCVYG